MKYTANYIEEILQKYDKNLKKSLGQNFLFDGQILDAIVGAAVENNSDNIIEIGAGVGILTNLLCEKAKKVVTVEIDKTLEPILEKEVKRANFALHLEDVLSADLAALSTRYFGGERFCVVGNLPYYITGKIVEKLAVNLPLFTRAVIMVQREAADRFMSDVGSKEYRASTVMVQALFDIELVCKVPPHCFVPAPRVESAVITLTPRQRPLVKNEDIPAFLRFLFAAFSSRRKQLKGLAGALGTTADKISESLEALGLSPLSRAEALSPEQTVELFYKLR